MGKEIDIMMGESNFFEEKKAAIRLIKQIHDGAKDCQIPILFALCVAYIKHWFMRIVEKGLKKNSIRNGNVNINRGGHKVVITRIFRRHIVLNYKERV